MVQKLLQFVSLVVMAGAPAARVCRTCGPQRDLIRVFQQREGIKGDLAVALEVASAIYAEAGIGIT
jgi:hypothetical protein